MCVLRLASASVCVWSQNISLVAVTNYRHQHQELFLQTFYHISSPLRESCDTDTHGCVREQLHYVLYVVFGCFLRHKRPNIVAKNLSSATELIEVKKSDFDTFVLLQRLYNALVWVSSPYMDLYNPFHQPSESKGWREKVGIE